MPQHWPTAHLDQATAAAVRRDLLDALGDRSVIVLGHAPDPSNRLGGDTDATDSADDDGSGRLALTVTTTA